MSKVFRAFAALIIIMSIVVPDGKVLGLSADQTNIYSSGIYYFDTNPGAAGGSGCSLPSIGSDPLKTAFDYFLGNRLSPVQAAAVVGNLDEESGMNPVQIQNPPGGTTNDPSALTNSSVGWGIAQWSPGNKIIDIASNLDIPGPIYELSTQLQIVLGEMKGTSPNGVQDMIAGLQKITDIAQSTEYFRANFEGGDPSPARLTDAQQVLKQYGSDTGSTSIGCGSTATGPSGCVDPFSQAKNLSPERIDMGVDYAGSAGSPILAMCDSKVIAVAPGGTGWSSPTNTQACVYLQITAGAYSGKSYYVCEDIAPTVTKDQVVHAGDVIAKFLRSPTGLETGWGSGTPYGSLAAQLNQQCQNGDPGCWSTAAGISFNKLLVSTGTQSGVFESGAPSQSMPPGYP